MFKPLRSLDSDAGVRLPMENGQFERTKCGWNLSRDLPTIYAVALGALGSAVLLANAFKVLRPMPAVAPANTNVNPLWRAVVETCGEASRALDAFT